MSPDGSDGKVVFGSQAWLAAAAEVLEQLVRQHGEVGRSFSACEVFTDAPEGVAGPQGAAMAWHFRIVDRTVTIGSGEIRGADLSVRVRYKWAIRGARMQYPGFLVWLAWPQQAILRLLGRPIPPPYLLELHNRLARITR